MPGVQNILRGTRVYLSGPMDFVGSRVVEKHLGWRALLTPILKALEVTVLDPWNKPQVRGHTDYGQEGVLPSKEGYEADFWTNPATRARFEKDFWETVHIDCRMTDVSDFLISFVPTNIYSVGTVHEIVLARSQFKPVLFVSPPVKYEFFPELDRLPAEVKDLLRFYGLKENPEGIPSQWYGNIVGGHNMFDGFGWEALPFKEPDFYGRLIEGVLESSRPAADGPELRAWQAVREWVLGHPRLRELTGSALDYLSPANPDEKRLLDKEMSAPAERQRRFFWYNRPYQPRRPMLYQLLSIASGNIPPRTNVINRLDPSGHIERVTFDAVDDDWLLLAPED
ncbi:MAG: hypothetical protein N2322_05040 [Terrimicrobiaceae bacterium]|nr:hypothetical protein [Terrimicrobiaceae bacterium]